MGIRDDQKAKVVMITSSRDLQTVKAARDSHCDAHLVKLVERERVIEEVTRLWSLLDRGRRNESSVVRVPADHWEPQPGSACRSGD
jgi:hypothetical protein